MINSSVFLYNGRNKFQFKLIFTNEFNKKTNFWLNSNWNNYKHFSSPNLVVTYFLVCDFEKFSACPAAFDKKSFTSIPAEKILKWPSVCL